MICDRWGLQDKRIRVFHVKNGGVSAARNVGICEATGEWLVFIDSDDIVDNRFLGTLLTGQIENRAGMTACGYRYFTEEWEPEDTVFPDYRRLSRKQFVTARGGEYVCGAIYDLNTVKKYHIHFDDHLKRHEEVFWNTVYSVYNNRRVFVKPPLYFYRVNPHSIMHSKVDAETEIRAWIQTRNALIEWGRNQHLQGLQHFRLLQGKLHCSKNVYAESVAGNISYFDFIKVFSQVAPTASKPSKIYYFIISCMIRLYNKLSG